MQPLFWVEKEENPFPSKDLIFFPICPPPPQIFRPSAGIVLRAQWRAAVINETIQNLTS